MSPKKAEIDFTGGSCIIDSRKSALIADSADRLKASRNFFVWSDTLSFGGSLVTDNSTVTAVTITLIYSNTKKLITQTFFALFPRNFY